MLGGKLTDFPNERLGGRVSLKTLGWRLEMREGKL